MSDAFGEDNVESFLDNLQHEQRLAVASEEEYDQQRTTLYIDLIQTFDEQGITAIIKDPRDSQHPYDILEITATNDGLLQDDNARDTWVKFAKSLVIAKGFISVGEGESDPLAREETEKGFANILSAERISAAEKRAAIRAAETYLGKHLTSVALASWGIASEYDIADDEIFETRVAIMRTVLDTSEAQYLHNREIKHNLRTIVEARLAEVLPLDHDDFHVLLLDLENAIRVQFEPEFIERAARTTLEQELAEGLMFFEGDCITRNRLDVDALVQIAIGMVPAYRTLGYRSTRDIS